MLVNKAQHNRCILVVGVIVDKKGVDRVGVEVLVEEGVVVAVEGLPHHHSQAQRGR